MAMGWLPPVSLPLYLMPAMVSRRPLRSSWAPSMMRPAPRCTPSRSWARTALLSLPAPPLIQ